MDDQALANETSSVRRRCRQQLNKKCPLVTYTVGWIAALKHELIAALAMLEERHAEPDDFLRHDKDTNTYHYGQIGPHNVVITSLGKPYGTSSAASTATELSMSHPHIRFGLLVGIGAGVPRPRHDVRLGDVVVSEPQGISGGVVQYDLLKAKAGENELTGYLLPPPLALQKAVISLASEHALDGSDVAAIMESALEAKSELAKDQSWRYQGREKDLLSEETFKRVGDNSSQSIATAENDGPVPRIERSSTNPHIHYGIIGSGNALIKDLAEREAILKLLPSECLCLEMEAAGLMNTFPCLVVRGICDYGDARKNDDWQQYAALAAAAYTKELLESMTSRDVTREPKAIDVMSDAIQRLELQTTELIDLAHHRQAEIEIKWLSSGDRSDYLNTNLKNHVQGTGSWFLESLEFTQWVQSDDSSTLFCSGPPGAGKSILASIAIDYLLRKVQTATRPVAYLYFDYRRPDVQSLDTCLASILSQLAVVNSCAYTAVHKFYVQHHGNETRPRNRELRDALSDVCDQISQTLVVIDGLDECDRKVCDKVVSYLLSLQESGRHKAMFISRPLPRIADLFKNALKLQIEASTQDVVHYIGSRIVELPNCVRKSPEIVETVTQAVLQAADGVFLLARLHVDSLLDCLTGNEVDLALKRLSLKAPDIAGSAHADQTRMDYDAAYEIALQRVFHQQDRIRSWLQRMFELVAFTKRTLTRQELQTALAFDPRKMYLDFGDMPDVTELLGYCAGLVITADTQRYSIEGQTSEQEDVVFAHFTVQEYLERTRASYFPDANLNLFNCCIGYLGFDCFLPSKVRSSIECSAFGIDCSHWKRQYPFFAYAQCHWEAHLEDLDRDTSDTPRNLLERPILWYFREFVVLRAESFEGSRGLFSLLRYESAYRIRSQTYVPLLLGAAQRSLSLSKPLGNPSHQADFFSSTRNAFSLIAAIGHEEYVRIILDCVQNSTAEWNKSKETDFLEAVTSGRWNIAHRLVPLIAAGWKDIKLRTALAERDNAYQLIFLQSLLGVSPAALRTSDQITPLHFAAGNGHEDTVSMLLPFLSCHARDQQGLTPLHYAASNNHVGVISCLIPHSDCSAKSIDHRTPLHCAVQYKAKEAVSALLPYSDCNAKDNDGQTPLHLAVSKCNLPAVQLIMPYSDSAAIDNAGRTPLQCAPLEWYDAIQELLKACMKPVTGIQRTLPLSRTRFRGCLASALLTNEGRRTGSTSPKRRMAETLMQEEDRSHRRRVRSQPAPFERHPTMPT